MNVDHDQPHLNTKVHTLQTLTAGPLSSSIANLSASSRCIPSDKDFHFYRNFDEFKAPIADIARESQSILEAIGASGKIWGREAAPLAAGAFPADMDDAYDWLVSVNDDILERFDVMVDEFKRVRQEEEETGRPASSAAAMEDDGFQLVCGKKKRGGSRLGSPGNATMDSETSLAASAVKVATKDKKTAGPKPKVPFHIPTIRRPQEEYNILVNNSNMPFEHVWLERSDDGLKFIHPLEKLNVLDFVDKDLSNLVPVKPSSLDSTPFKLVDDVKGLKELAAKLRSVDEFAVDLEHNQYRSFQGLTCLMQISTRSEDFVVDTLKLRIHVGPYLREIFKDPLKRKVMHGADRDIVWLQRDFGIYICNLFDTGQASKVLKLERNSLEYLLHHFCEVTANKEYQNADWRLRPLPNEMQRYAREDTHYLLYMYDLMRIKLFSMPKESESSDTPLVEVYKRSYDVCMQLYEKELLTEGSYLHIYGLQGADFNAQQLAIVSGLCEWRDLVARAEDESTGYVLPNKSLLEIAKQMPLTTSKLRRLVKSKHPYIEHNLDTVVSIIRNSLQNAAAFEDAALQLKQLAASASDAVNVKSGIEDTQRHTHNSQNIKETIQQQGTDIIVKIKPPSLPSELPKDSLTVTEQHKDGNDSTFTTTKVTKVIHFKMLFQFFCLQLRSVDLIVAISLIGKWCHC
ncbi:Protein RRP6-like 2, variant 2 [Stylosanthes scabra]|uniref:Protein RRP6-like 2, variant 2 n=1 Tax=Stylosanthes scabra TaxID=79078 RepID=A0ABU6XEI6_9FABA|nr:Protein RRP6-like 2, variant 2 [Stylosanthes scabra]